MIGVEDILVRSSSPLEHLPRFVKRRFVHTTQLFPFLRMCNGDRETYKVGSWRTKLSDVQCSTTLQICVRPSESFRDLFPGASGASGCSSDNDNVLMNHMGVGGGKRR